MKRMKMTMWMMAMVVTGMFFSCQHYPELVTVESMPDDEPAVVISTGIMYNEWMEAANPLNPYDEVGYWHNRILVDTESCRGVRQQAGDVAVTHCIRQFVLTELGVDLSQQELLAVLESVMPEYDNLFIQVVENSVLEEYVKHYLRRILETVRGYGGENNWWGSYDEFKQAIQQLETEVLHDPVLSDWERKAVLSVSSVARYSGLYWMNLEIEDNPAAFSKFKNFMIKVAGISGDIGGAIGGLMDDSVTLGEIAGHAAASSARCRDSVIYGMPG